MRNNRILAMIICIVMLFSLVSFVGCSKEDNETDAENPVVTNSQSIGVNVGDDMILMNGFEHMERDVMMIRLISRFGRLEQNHDEKYIHSGENSLHVIPMGSRGSSARPWITLPLSSVRFPEVDFADFTKVDKLSMWVYNNKEEETEIGFGFLLQYNSNMFDDLGTRSILDYATINPGWNYVEFDFDPSNYYYAKPQLDLSQFVAMVLDFDANPSYKYEDAADVYIDDICVSYQETAREIADPFTEITKGTNLDGNEYWMIADFEKASEQFIFNAGTRGVDFFLRATSPAKYGTLAKSGTQVLEVRTNNSIKTMLFGLPCSVIKRVVDSIGQDVIDNPENYALKFDAYNAMDEQVNWYSRSEIFNGDFSIPAKEWSTHTVPCTFIFGTVYTDPRYPSPETIKGYGYDLLSKPDTSFSFLTTPSTEAVEGITLFDNFRIEKIK